MKKFSVFPLLLSFPGFNALSGSALFCVDAIGEVL